MRHVDAQPVFKAAAVERRAVAELLEGLSESQLATPSLCAAWDIRTVAAHLAAAVAPSKKPFLLATLRSSGNLSRANDRVARQAARQPVADLAGTLRRHAASTFAPPLVGPRGPLTDVLVHAGDIRLPLGLAHHPAQGAVRLALDFVTEGRPLGFVPRGRLDGLKLIADDLEWSWGTGPAISGRGIDLLIATCGRSAVLPSLTGPGVPGLGARLPR